MKTRRNKKKRYGGLRPKTWRDIVYTLFIVAFVSKAGYDFQHTSHHLLSPIGKVEAVAQAITTPAPLANTLVVDSNRTPTQEEVEAYIRRIFLSDASTAIAISHAECSPANKQYPRCVAASSVEHSVGIFQINLYNSEQKVHADRIPGTTMQEKEEWLADPFNNTLYAYWIFSTSGWNPWSTYLNGAYLNQ